MVRLLYEVSFCRTLYERIEEVELIQKNLLKIFIFESEKKDYDNKKNKFLMNQLAKTIVENSKVLAEFGMAPPILAKIKSLIPLEVSTTIKNGKKINKQCKG
jgi:hypothetical protein